MATPGTQRLQGVAVGTDYCTQKTHTNTATPGDTTKRRQKAHTRHEENDLDARIYRNGVGESNSKIKHYYGFTRTLLYFFSRARELAAEL